MPKYKVTKGHDAWVYYETVVEADTPQEAREIAGCIQYAGPWAKTGEVVEFDHFDMMEEVEEVEE